MEKGWVPARFVMSQPRPSLFEEGSTTVTALISAHIQRFTSVTRSRTDAPGGPGWGRTAASRHSAGQCRTASRTDRVSESAEEGRDVLLELER
eukprot:277041-Hanusia_phi.AAC.1